MIRIPVTSDNLEASINKLNATWLKRAAARTATYARAKRYTGGSEFWGQIKDIYIDLQFEKCAYCESKLAGKKLSSKVHEVEHFRPKSRIRKWPGAKSKFVPPCAVGGENAKGYFLLAYHPFNYAIACTRCNSTLKSDFFPVRGKRKTAGSTPSAMAAEDHLLIYPISNVDRDPADLIHFDGVLAVPAKKKGADFERALVTIEFFQLNHEDLTTRRAPIIAQLFNALETIRRVIHMPADLKKRHQDAIDNLTRPSSPFSACAAAFVALYASDYKRAKTFAELASKLTRA